MADSKLIFWLLLLTSLARGAVGPRTAAFGGRHKLEVSNDYRVDSAASNFAVDLFGSPDLRPGCWGLADARTATITFHPPAGYRVRILRLRGDFLAWPRVLPGEDPVPAGRYAGALLGFQTTAPEGSAWADWASDNTLLYIQVATSGEVARASYNDDVSVGGLLEPDHRLLVKMAAWLNATSKPIHMEPTFVLTYQFEKRELR